MGNSNEKFVTVDTVDGKCILDVEEKLLINEFGSDYKEKIAKLTEKQLRDGMLSCDSFHLSSGKLNHIKIVKGSIKEGE